MCTLKTFIIDDESDAAKLLENLLDDIKNIEVEKVFLDAEEALHAVLIEKPYAVFADIEMPQIDGIEFLKTINEYSPSTKVIFVTAYQHYALKAIQENAFDFLCKPIIKGELQRVVYKLLSVFGDERKLLKNENDRILMKTQEGYHYINLNDILYFEADGNYTVLKLIGGTEFIASTNIGKMYDTLSNDIFIRISRKHLINKRYLAFMNFNKHYCVLQHNGLSVQLSISVKMKELKEILS